MTTATMIANIEMNNGQLVIMDLSNHIITRKTLISGETLVGFSTDLIVTLKQSQVISYTSECREISRMNVFPGDAVRGVIGPNILIYRVKGNYLGTYNRNFNEITRRYLSK